MPLFPYLIMGMSYFFLSFIDPPLGEFDEILPPKDISSQMV